MILLTPTNVRLQRHMANRPHTHGANCSLILAMQINLPTNSNLFPSSATSAGGWNLLGAISGLQRTPHITDTPLRDVGPIVHDSFILVSVIFWKNTLGGGGARL
jgi:hypothetical protein